MAHGLDDVAGARFPLGPDQGRPFGDTPQSLAQVGGATHEGHRERPLVDVVGLVGRREHLALVDVVHAQSLEDLGLGEVADAGFGHHGNGDRGLDALDHGRIAHARHTAVPTDVGRHPLERHHCDRARILGDLGLLGRDHVHDHATPEHLGQASLDAIGARLAFHALSLGAPYLLNGCRRPDGLDFDPRGARCDLDGRPHGIGERRRRLCRRLRPASSRWRS